MIACKVCGKQFRFLPPHLNRTHGVSADEYRATYGIPAGAPLCSDDYKMTEPAARKKPGRKPLAEGAGKTSRVQLKLTDAEKARWLAEAESAGLSLQAWVEHKCRAKR